MTGVPGTRIRITRFSDAQSAGPDIAHPIAGHAPTLRTAAQVEGVPAEVDEGAVLDHAVRRVGGPERAPDGHGRLGRLDSFARNTIIGLGEGDSRKGHSLNDAF